MAAKQDFEVERVLETKGEEEEDSMRGEEEKDKTETDKEEKEEGGYKIHHFK